MRRRLRTRSKRRKQVRTPSGVNRLHFFEERPGPRRCRFCGSILSGVSIDPRAAHSMKTVERRYGGEVCHRCLEKSILVSAAAEWGL
ncbi:MAG: hypothetical protein QXN23_04670 [Candidatus Caldarchaeum sp.]|nr:50S ribosomal protein L34e [Candidatus Caldarchaeales archaeon]